MTFDVELFRALTQAPGPTGFEGPVMRVVRERLSAVAKPQGDALGNLWARVGSEGDLEMAVVAHADQIGLIVTYIDEQGFVWFDHIGGIDRQLLPGHAVAIHAAGSVVDGVVGRKPTHLIPQEDRGKAPELHEQYIDIGVHDRAAALERVAVGDPVTFAQRFLELSPGVYATLACDDRAGVYAACRALEERAAAGIGAALTAVATVHEETSFMGAKAQTHLLRADVVVVVDCDFATDQPDVDVKNAGGEIKLGGGAVVVRGAGSNERLFRRAVEVARREKIPFQIKAVGGRMMTDADELMAGGAATLSLEIPLRYMHGPFEVVRGDDMEATVSLIAALTSELGGSSPDSFRD
ncbi:MAG TPA: M42 family peptidase [Thermoleophilia bacterium]|nr:M42 family peptidase [Thermoleophilia bacterium]